MLADKKLEDRKQSFKPSRIEGHAREKYAMALRKKKKNSSLMEKRTKMLEKESESANYPTKYEYFIKDINPILLDSKATPEEKLKIISETLNEPINDPYRIHAIVFFIKKLLLPESDEIIETAIKLGFIEKLTAMLDIDHEQIRLETVWALTNISGGSDNSVPIMRKLDLHHRLMALIRVSNISLIEQCLWVLGNMCADSEEALAEVLSTGIVELLVDLILLKNAKLSLIRIVSWVMAHLCRCHYSFLQQITPILPCLNSALLAHDDEVIVESLNSITRICEKSPELILEHFNLDRVVWYLNSPNEEVRYAAMTAIGGICLGTEKEIERLLQTSCLEAVKEILTSSNNEAIVQSACWTISNIALGPTEHIQKILNAKLLKPLCEILHSSFDYPVKKEAAWGISNAITKGNTEQVHAIIEAEAMPSLVLVLDKEDLALQFTILEAVEKILATDESAAENTMATKFDAVGGLSILEELQAHPNTELANAAIKIIDKFYSHEETAA